MSIFAGKTQDQDSTRQCGIWRLSTNWGDGEPGFTLSFRSLPSRKPPSPLVGVSPQQRIRQLTAARLRYVFPQAYITSDHSTLCCYALTRWPMSTCVMGSQACCGAVTELPSTSGRYQHSPASSIKVIQYNAMVLKLASPTSLSYKAMKTYHSNMRKPSFKGIPRNLHSPRLGFGSPEKERDRAPRLPMHRVRSS